MKTKLRCDGCSNLFSPDDLVSVRVHTGRTDTNCIDCGKRWYVVAVMDDDADVAHRIMREARINRLDDRIAETQVVRYKDTEVKDGRVRRLKRKAWEGYVLVRMLADADTIHLVQNVRDVIGLLPLKPALKSYRYPRKEPKQSRPVAKRDVEAHEAWFPQAIDPSEVETMIKMVAASREPDPEPVEFKAGDKVTIAGTTTMFEGQTGTVTKVLADEEYEVAFRVLGTETRVIYAYTDLTQAETLS